MIKLVPPIAVPIRFNDIMKTIFGFIFKSKKKLKYCFNTQVNEYTGYKYVRTFQSGYLALYHLLIKLKENSNKEEILIPVYTCPSVYYAVKNAKLNPKYVDADLQSFNISIDEICSSLTENTLAIVVVYLFGFKSVNILLLRKKLIKIGRPDVIIIEDMCQFLGKTNEDKRYDDNLGDYGILSFGRAKFISTINGGAIVSNNTHIFNTIDSEYKPSVFFNIELFIKTIVFGVIITSLFYRITNMILQKKRQLDPYNLKDYSNIDHRNLSDLSSFQLSLGNQMFKRLKSFNDRRHKNGCFYSNYFSDNSKFIIQPTTNNLYLRFAIVFRDKGEKKLAQEFLFQKGIMTSTADYPLLSTVRNDFANNESVQFEVASFIATNILTLPTHPGFDAKEYPKVFNELLELLNHNT
jgi:dTDP-4-amino-4,6-dideoxygalactose transaminase